MLTTPNCKHAKQNAEERSAQIIVLDIIKVEAEWGISEYHRISDVIPSPFWSIHSWVICFRHFRES